MKKLSWLAVILIVAMTSWAVIGCGDSSDDDADFFASLFNVNATQGPNKKVVEPEEILNITPNGNFILEEDPAAKADKVVKLALAVTNEGSYGLDYDPHNLIYDSMDLGYMMAKVAADYPTDTACTQLETQLTNDVEPDCVYTGLPDNCSITSEEKGRAVIAFKTDGSGGCNFSFTNDENEGDIEVRGKLLDPLYPFLDGAPGVDCDIEECKDVKVAALSGNFSILNDNDGNAPDYSGDAFTSKSVVSGYALNYGLTTEPNIEDLPLYIIANVQVNTENMALALAMPEGLQNSASQFYGGVIDDDGKIYGINYGNKDGTPPADLLIMTLPVQQGGAFCYSWFKNAGTNTWTLDTSESGDNCGLTDGMTVTP